MCKLKKVKKYPRETKAIFHTIYESMIYMHLIWLEVVVSFLLIFHQRVSDLNKTGQKIAYMKIVLK